MNKLEEASKQSEKDIRSFYNYKNKVLESDPNYTWAASYIKNGKIDSLALSLIPPEINKGPMILSLGFHVYTVVECNNLGGLRLHDTRIGKLVSKSLDEMRKELPEGNKNETDMLIIRPK